jgi:Tfp pilus assembly protein PilO
MPDVDSKVRKVFKWTVPTVLGVILAALAILGWFGLSPKEVQTKAAAKEEHKAIKDDYQEKFDAVQAHHSEMLERIKDNQAENKELREETNNNYNKLERRMYRIQERLPR